MAAYELHHGDCLDVMPTLEPASVEMCFADLPYGEKSGEITANAWDAGFDLQSFWSCLRAVRGKKAATLMTAKMVFACSLIMSNRKEFRHDMVYVKSRATRHHHAKRMPLSAHEHVLIFAKGQPTYNPQMRVHKKRCVHGGTAKSSANYNSEPNLALLKGKIYTHGYPTTVLPVVSENGLIHPTQKPLALLEWLISTYTSPGDTVLDPVFGSCTTGIACARLGRNFIGIEKDATYFAAGKARLEAEHARLASEAA